MTTELSFPQFQKALPEMRTELRLLPSKIKVTLTKHHVMATKFVRDWTGSPLDHKAVHCKVTNMAQPLRDVGYCVQCQYHPYRGEYTFTMEMEGEDNDG